MTHRLWVILRLNRDSTSCRGLSDGYIDVGDGYWRRNLFVTTLKYWQFWPFSSPTSSIFNISVGHQQPKDVNNIEILSLTSENCHQDKVVQIFLALGDRFENFFSILSQKWNAYGHSFEINNLLGQKFSYRKKLWIFCRFIDKNTT